MVLDSLLSLQPATAAAAGGASKEALVTAIATDLVDQVPPPFNLEAVMRAKGDDPSALHVVLFQEVERYNVLLVQVRKSCAELLRGIQGLVVMSAGARSALHARCMPPGRRVTCHGWQCELAAQRCCQRALCELCFQGSGCQICQYCCAGAVPTRAHCFSVHV